MAIDTRIPLLVQNIDTATPLSRLSAGIAEKNRYNDEKKFRQERVDKEDARYEDTTKYQRGRDAKEDERQTRIDALNKESNELSNQLKEEQIAQARFSSASEREKQAITSTVHAAAQLGTFLESGDVGGAEAFLNNRKRTLLSRIAGGENIDTQETDRALQLLKEDPEKLKSSVGSYIKFGQMTGMIAKAAEPEGFTLGPEEKRFEASGKLIASGPEKKEKPPEGYRYTTDGQSLEPIPGGKIERAQAAQASEAKVSIDRTIKSVQDALGFIEGKKDDLVFDGTGAPAQFTAWLKSSDAGTLDSIVTQINSEAAIGALLKMKEASANGASGFGALQKAELDLLLSKIAKLDVGLKPAVLKKNLLEVKNHFENLKGQLDEGLEGSSTGGGAVDYQEYFK